MHAPAVNSGNACQPPILCSQTSPPLLSTHFKLSLLQREADLLEQPQRDALAAMIEDHEALLTGSTAATNLANTARLGGMGGGGGHQPAALQSLLPGARSSMLPPNASPAMLAHRMVAPPQLAGRAELEELRRGALGGNRGRLAALFDTSSILSNDASIDHFL